MADERTEKQKVKEITDRLEEGLKELFESEKYKSYLSTMSKFHNYSYNNTLLIAMQNPEATLVAGYGAWQKNFNRHVNKGEKAIRILAPAPKKIKEERNKLEPVTGEMMFDEQGMPQKEIVEITIPNFRVVSIFDVGQTSGEPIPELEVKELLSTVEGYEDFVQALMNVSPVPIDFEDIPGESRGYFSTDRKLIMVQENMSESQTLKTMVHEVAHSMLHDKEVNQSLSVPAKDRNTKEVEAESIAYTVCQHFGIDTSDYSFSYIAGWSSGKEMRELKFSLDVIRKTASELITGIEGQIRALQLEREQEQTQEIGGIDENLSIMKQAEILIGELEEKRTIFTPEERDLIVNYAYKLGDMEKTKELAEKLAYMETYSPNNVALTIIDAQAEIDALPDSMIGLSEMGEYGYTWIEMLPLTQEKALELFDHDVPVYLLHEDNSETAVEERKQITEHTGIFGVEKADWEKVKDRIAMMEEVKAGEVGREAQLFHGASDKYGIYQLKDKPELRNFRFMGTESLKRLGITKDNFEEIQPENYSLIYTGDLAELQRQTKGATLEAIYQKFNTDHPEDFRGHSLSVSDIVVLHQDGEYFSHFVDSFGFTGLPLFTEKLLEEQGIERAATSGHDVQKLQPVKEETEVSDRKTEKTELEQPETGETEKKQSVINNHEPKTEENKKHTEELFDEGDEIIDLGDDREQVLATMKQSLDSEQDTSGHNVQKLEQDTSGHNVQKSEMQVTESIEETELAFSIADRFITIQETEEGYDYSIMGMDYKEIDGGVYDNPDITIREALEEIVEDLKTNPDYNGAKGNIQKDDVLIPMDYDGLMEKVEESNRIQPVQAQSSVVADFKAKTNELFHDISEMNPTEVEDTVKCHVQAVLNEAGIDAAIVDVAVVGSRCRGLEQEGSDLDVAVEFATSEREDDLFHILNGSDALHIGGIKVDINPITAQRTGTLETYLPVVEEYLEAVRIEREQEAARQTQDTSGHDVQKSEQWGQETEVTFVVAECGEFHSYGELHENIPTAEEAISIWQQIPSERINGIPSIGIHIHRQGEESHLDREIDLVSGKSIDLGMLEYVPEIKNNPKSMEVIAELIAKLPKLEIEGTLSEELEQKVRLIRLSEKIPLEQLAVNIDQFSYDYNPHEYRNTIESREEGILSVQYSLASGDTEHLAEWLQNIIDEGEPNEDVAKAKELLGRLSEYKPLAKIEEIEEQNYNAIDEVLNNGFEQGKKAETQKKAEVPKEQEKPAAKVSLKGRLAQKKALIAGQSQSQDTEKKNQREM